MRFHLDFQRSRLRVTAVIGIFIPAPPPPTRSKSESADLGSSSTSTASAASTPSSASSSGDGQGGGGSRGDEERGGGGAARGDGDVRTESNALLLVRLLAHCEVQLGQLDHADTKDAQSVVQRSSEAAPSDGEARDGMASPTVAPHAEKVHDATADASAVHSSAATAMAEGVAAGSSSVAVSTGHVRYLVRAARRQPIIDRRTLGAAARMLAVRYEHAPLEELPACLRRVRAGKKHAEADKLSHEAKGGSGVRPHRRDRHARGSPSRVVEERRRGADVEAFEEANLAPPMDGVAEGVVFGVAERVASEMAAAVVNADAAGAADSGIGSDGAADPNPTESAAMASEGGELKAVPAATTASCDGRDAITVSTSHPARRLEQSRPAMLAAVAAQRTTLTSIPPSPSRSLPDSPFPSLPQTPRALGPGGCSSEDRGSGTGSGGDGDADKGMLLGGSGDEGVGINGGSGDDESGAEGGEDGDVESILSAESICGDHLPSWRGDGSRATSGAPSPVPNSLASSSVPESETEAANAEDVAGTAALPLLGLRRRRRSAPTTQRDDDAGAAAPASKARGDGGTSGGIVREQRLSSRTSRKSERSERHSRRATRTGRDASGARVDRSTDDAEGPSTAGGDSGHADAAEGRCSASMEDEPASAATQTTEQLLATVAAVLTTAGCARERWRTSPRARVCMLQSSEPVRGWPGVRAAWIEPHQRLRAQGARDGKV